MAAGSEEDAFEDFDELALDEMLDQTYVSTTAKRAQKRATSLSAVSVLTREDIQGFLIMAGDRETGVCLMQMDAGLDTGPVIASAACPIEPDDTAGRLHDRLSVMGAQLLKENLDRIARG